ncbi:MAG: 4a-hydroxytetrahydrobiopterin dehydratase [Polyangiaceae bacterium]
MSLEAQIATLDGWEVRGDRLYKQFKFSDFVTAFGWMAQLALVAERSNHHPEWRNVYNRVDVELTTHDTGGISERDIALAHAMDEAAAKLTS